MSRDAAYTYVLRMRAEGRSDDDIREAFRTSGWADADIDALLAFVTGTPPPPDPPYHDAKPAQAHAQPRVNNSGTGGDPPAQVAEMRWCWGAFGLSWIWGIGNRVWITLIALALGAVGEVLGVSAFLSMRATGLPPHGPSTLVHTVLNVLALGFSIWLGLKGHSLAWKHRRFRNLEQFRATMRVWNKWGLGFFIGALLVGGGLGLYLGLSSTLPRVSGMQRETACLENVHDISLAFLLYSQDHGDTFPNSQNWPTAIRPYLRNDAVLRCPSGGAYAMNAALSGVAMANVPSPAETLLVYEVDATGQPIYPHGDKMNVGYADGHIRGLRHADAQALLAQTGGGALQPPAGQPTQ